MSTQLPPEIVQLAQTQTSAPPSHWWVRDLSKSYGWLQGYGVFWILEGAHTSMVIVRADQGAPFCTNCDQTYQALSRLIDQALGGKPWDRVGVEEFCTILVEFTGDPRFKLATSDFVKKQILESWLSAKERDPGVFAGSAKTPDLAVNDSTWEATFNVFNFKGGVDQWVVSGRVRPFVIVSKTITVIHPDGTFYYPFEF